jgi:hypothetical protein
MMSQDCQLAGDRHHRPLLGVLAPPFRRAQSPVAQIAVGAEGTRDALGTVDQQAPQVASTGLGDSQLRVTISRLVASGDQTQGGANLPGLPEAGWVFQGEDKRQRRQRADADGTAQAARLGITLAAEDLDLLAATADLLIEGSNALQDRPQGCLERVWDGRGHLGGETMRGARGKMGTSSPGGSPEVVDQQSAGTDEGVPGARMARCAWASGERG